MNSLSKAQATFYKNFLQDKAMPASGWEIIVSAGDRRACQVSPSSVIDFCVLKYMQERKPVYVRSCAYGPGV